MPATQRESQVHVCTCSPSTSTHARARTSGGSGSHASPTPPGLAVVVATLRRCRCRCRCRYRYRCVVLPPRQGRCGVRGVQELVVVLLIRRVRLRGRAAPPRRRRAGLDGDHRRGGSGGGGPEGVEVEDTKAGVGRARGRGRRAQPPPRPPPHPQLRWRRRRCRFVREVGRVSECTMREGQSGFPSEASSILNTLRLNAFFIYKWCYWNHSGDKKLLTPQPRLRTGFFSFLESQMIPTGCIPEACTSVGAAKYGRPIGLDEMIKVDLIVIGSVAVDPSTGARLGKGEGFAELEYGMLRYMGAIDDSTMVVTTVHDKQLVDDIPVEKLLIHDVPVDIICTPTQVILTNTAIPKPQGIYWEKLSPEKLGQIRILRELKRRIEQETGTILPCGPSENLPPTAQRGRRRGR